MELTPVDHDPFDPAIAGQEGAVPKEGHSLPANGGVRTAITDYPAVQEAGRNIASMAVEPFAQVGRLMTQGTSDPELAGDTESMILGAAPIGGKVAAAGKGLLAPLASMFAGIGAKTADREALKLAQQMLTKGHTADEIWKATGWFQGADQKWRFEIPDEKLEVRPEGTEKGLGSESQLQHQELLAAYPQMSDLTHVQQKNSSYGGSYFSRNPRNPGGHIVMRGTSDEERRQVAAHELQHAVQDIEGFARGENPATLRPIADRAYLETGGSYDDPNWNRKVYDLTVESYKRHAGEVEARNVESRLYDSAEARAKNPPWTTEDRPRDKQIVRGVKLTPVDHDPFKGQPMASEDSKVSDYGGKLKSLETSSAEFDSLVAKMRLDPTIKQPDLHKLAAEYLGWSPAASKSKADLFRLITDKQMLEARQTARAPHQIGGGS
jgi:hypothetical protein